MQQHERLQHRVVEMGGHSRPLVLADPLRPFVVEPLEQSAEGRGGEDRQPTYDDGDRTGGLTDTGEAAGAAGERGDAGEEQHDAGENLDDAQLETADGGGESERPHDRDPDTDGAGREHDSVAGPQADHPTGHEHGCGEAADRQLAPPSVA